MNIKEFFAPLVDKLHESANVKTVYGDPISVEGKTIIPVAKVAYGFGGGPRLQGSDNVPVEAGIGAAGGTGVVPLGVLEVTADDTRYISVPDSGPIKLFGALFVGFVIGVVLASRKRKSHDVLD